MCGFATNCSQITYMYMYEITVILPDQFLSEHMRETVKTIDWSTVRECEPFLEFQKTVKNTIYIRI